MSIFQETQNSKKSENSDNKTADYSSIKITKIYFQKKSFSNLFGQKMESTPPQYAPSISQLLIIPCIGHSKSYFLPLVLNGKQEVSFKKISADSSRSCLLRIRILYTHFSHIIKATLSSFKHFFEIIPVLPR